MIAAGEALKIAENQEKRSQPRRRVWAGEARRAPTPSHLGGNRPRIRHRRGPIDDGIALSRPENDCSLRSPERLRFAAAKRATTNRWPGCTDAADHIFVGVRALRLEHVLAHRTRRLGRPRSTAYRCEVEVNGAHADHVVLLEAASTATTAAGRGARCRRGPDAATPSPSRTRPTAGCLDTTPPYPRGPGRQRAVDGAAVGPAATGGGGGPARRHSAARLHRGRRPCKCWSPRLFTGARPRPSHETPWTPAFDRISLGS